MTSGRSVTSAPARSCPPPRSPRSRNTTRSCSAPSAIRTCRAGCLSAASCCGCGLSSTSTSTCARSACFPASARRSRRVAPIDALVVREGTEGAYIEAGGILRKGSPGEIAMQESVNTAFGVGRVIRQAFGYAAARPRRKLTLVHKTNVLAHAGDLWWRTFQAVAGRISSRDRRLLPCRRGADVHGDRSPICST